MSDRIATLQAHFYEKWGVATLHAEIERLRAELAAFKPTCAICGLSEPCEPTETACTFDPSPRALYEDNCRLRAALANEQARGVHTCHEQCQRPMCVMQRAITERDSIIERLRDRLAEAERLLRELQAGRVGNQIIMNPAERIRGYFARKSRESTAIDAAMAKP